MIILQTLWEIIKAIFIVCFIFCILYNICCFIDWIEYKTFEKRMNNYLEWKHQMNIREYEYEEHLQQIMREWNW